VNKKGIEIISSVDAPDVDKLASVPLSQAVRAGDFILVSGQVPTELDKLEPISGSIRDQTRLCLNHIKSILAAAGATLEDIVKIQVFLTDMSDFREMNEAYKEYFTQHKPARSAFGVKQLALDFKIEIEAIAYKPK
jgi:2-iminobutanoate/2-iminopropanoate deaminase